MIKKAKDWILKKTKGGQVDIHNCWIIDGVSIPDKDDFLIFIIEHVPDDSVWAIEGCYDENFLKELASFETEDNVAVYHGTMDEPVRIKIRLSKERKPRIIELIKKYGVDSLIHHHIYHDKHFYFTTYDNFSAYVAVSKKFDNKAMEDYAEKNNIKFIGPNF